MNTIAIIPCRMDSSRFPGKPMEKILGMPMVGHMYHRTRRAKNMSDVYVATCDQVIYDYVVSIGGKAVMTKNTHERATERVGEAVEKIEAKTKTPVDIAVMVQGDEPMIHPDTVDALPGPFLQDPAVQVVNLTNMITAQEEYADKNIVKLLTSRQGNVLWFFRVPSPRWEGRYDALPIDIQTGIIAFRRGALAQFNTLPETAMEKVESVDMFRFVEHDVPIATVRSEKRLYSVDTPDDLRRAEEKMKDDPMCSLYL